MTGFKLFFRRLKTTLWTALTLITLLAAVVVGVGKLLMPYSVQYKPQLEAWLSREFGQDVRIESFSGEWKAFGPRISLEGLNLQGTDLESRVIAIQHAALDIKPLNALMAGRPLYTFRIIGADLALVRNPDGRFELSGFGVSGRGGDGSGLNDLARVGEVRLEGASISYDDDVLGMHMQLVDVNGALQMDGRQLAVEVEASVSGTARQRVLGDLDATLLLNLDRQNRLRDASWHVKTRELMIAELGSQLPEHELMPLTGRLNAELWGDWASGQAQFMEGVLDLREASMAAAPEDISLDHVNTRFKWRWHDRKRWRLDLAGVQIEEGGRSWTAPRVTAERNIPGELGVWVSADYLRTDFPLRLTQRLMEGFNARWPRNVPKRGQGEIRDFEIVIDASKQLALARGDFTGLAVTDWGRWPKVDAISGQAELAFGQGEIRFSGEEVAVDWERNFRAPAVVDIPGCKLEILWAARGKVWQVDARECQASNEDIRLSGRSRFASSEGKPEVDLNLNIHRARLGALDDWWPASVMKPPVRDWLSRSLVDGEATGGRFLLSGDLDEFPFRQGEGTLEARVSVSGGVLDFHPDWPRADGVDAELLFRGPGMVAEGAITSVAGARVERVRAEIADFKAPALVIEYESGTDLPELAGFITASPLLNDSRLDLDAFEFGAAAAISGALSLPLGETPGELELSGRLDLSGNRFRHRASAQELEGISGAIGYDREGFRGEGLQAHYLGVPGRLDLEADWDADELFSARLSGRFPAGLIVAQAAFEDDPLLTRIEGDSDWLFELNVTDVQDQEEHETWLHLSSELQGVAMDLPAPLDKPAGAAWPLTLSYPLGSSEPVLTAGLAGRMALAVETREGLHGPVRAAVRLGQGQAELPPAGYFSIGGAAPRFDLDGWMDVVVEYFQAERYPDNLSLLRSALQAGELQLMNRRFSNVDIALQHEERELRMEFDGQAIAGVVRYRRTDERAHSLGAEMERLYLPEPLDEGMEVDTHPADLPELHVLIEQLRFHGMDLGEARIEAYPQGGGLRIESAESVSAQMNLQARGDWVMDENGARSDFDIVLTAESLGALVQAMDLSSVLRGGQTMIRYDAWWPGPPGDFALAVLNGEMQFSVIDGEVLTAEPGAGRVLGLISVAALPRRLALDFRDVFGSGFAFDQARGAIRLENGTAHTNDFIMESTAASLSISGSSDLVGQEFDYEMTVRPGVSQALPVIGAIAGGPGGAAAGLALQGLLRNSLGDAAEARYAIQGPWSEPEVTRLPADNAARTANGAGQAQEDEPQDD